MKKLICILLSVVVCMSILTGCENNDVLDAHEQDAKKIIFVGNSYTYYGETVLEVPQGLYDQDERKNDEGFFYQLCKANGMEVEVTNWTIGGHSIEDLLGNNCKANRGCDGTDHVSYLTDREYDYVVLQYGRKTAPDGDVLQICKPAMEIFKEANPDVKFLFLVQYPVHTKSYEWRSSIKNLESENITVVDWGALVADVMTGVVDVPGATLDYSSSSFVVGKSQNDGYHPNPLTGYITTLMTYCAITGESAVGQSYSFVEEPMPFDLFKTMYYTYNPVTNFDKAFKSESDMKGIQTLIDQYLEAKSYRNY